MAVYHAVICRPKSFVCSSNCPQATHVCLSFQTNLPLKPKESFVEVAQLIKFDQMIAYFDNVWQCLKLLKWLHTLTMFDNVWSCSNDCILWQCLTYNVWSYSNDCILWQFLQCLKLLKWLHTLATTFSWPQEREEVLLYQKELEMECFLWSLIDRHSKCSFFRFHYKWKFTYSSGNTQYCVRKYLLRFVH